MNLRTNIMMLKERKRELGWTNQRLSEEAGIPVGTLNKIFNGTTRYPRDKTIEAMIRALGMDYGSGAAAGVRNASSILRESGVYMAGGDKATINAYFSLPEELRVELIDGKFYYRAADGMRHQELLILLAGKFREYFHHINGKYRVFAGGCELSLDYEGHTMVRPDLFVMSNSEQFANRNYCQGVPELIVEIVSSDPDQEYERKRYKYQSVGVREYWIVDPVKMRIVSYTFSQDAVPEVYTFEDKIQSKVYPEFEVDFEKIKRDMM